MATIDKFFRRHLDIVDPYNVAASRLYFPISCPQPKYIRAFKYLIFIFSVNYSTDTQNMAEVL